MDSNHGLNSTTAELSSSLSLQPILLSLPFNTNLSYKDQSSESHWKWSKFKNPARSDDLELSHWSLSSSSSSSSSLKSLEESYPFAAFNVHAEVLDYSNEEWEKCKQLYHQGFGTWSKQETDYLFEMCKKWDLRFHLIADRWQPPTGCPSRDVDDLKEQYLKVTQAILQLRYPFPDPHQKQVLSSLLQFDKAQERERKKHLLSLWDRSSKEIQEEMELHARWMAFEKTYSQRMKERQEVLNRFYKGLDPYELAAHNTKRRKLKEGQFLSVMQAPPTIKGVIFSSEKKTPGAFLRSSKLSAIKPTLQNKLNVLLQELQISRPKMMTYEVFQRYEELRSSMLVLLEHKKTVEKLEMELKNVTSKQPWTSSANERRIHGPKEIKKRK